MRANQFISELRRNPEQNRQRDRGIATVAELLKGRNLERVGISMTELDKLGVNPQSRYDTPIGVYFYPAEYYLSLGGHVPFQRRAAYASVFEYGGRVLTTTEYTEQDFQQDVERLQQLYPDSEAKYWAEQAMDPDESEMQPRIDTPAGWLWFVTMRVCYEQVYDWGPISKKTTASRPKHVARWNQILRQLGYDVVVDLGQAVIHEGEPTQGVILNPRVIRPIQRVANKRGATYHDTVGQYLLTPDTADLVQWVTKTALSDPRYLQPDTSTDLPNHVRRTPGKLFRLFQRYIETVQADPSLWQRLGVPADKAAEAVAGAAPTKLKTQIIRLYQQSLQPRSGSASDQ